MNGTDIIEDQELLDYIADYFVNHKSTASTKRNTKNVCIESLDDTGYCLM
jgi:hypothetical protein